MLAVDLDLQGNLSAALGADLAELETTRKTVHRMLIDPSADYSEYIYHSQTRLDVLPASLDSEVSPALDSLVVSRELRLKDKLAPALNHYDYCVIDTPPSLGVPTMNGLVVADLVIIPIETYLFALLGLTQLLRVVAQVRQAHSPDQFTEEFVFRTTIPRLVSGG